MRWLKSNAFRDSAWVLSLFLVGLGAKFRLVLQSDSPLLYYDAWVAEALKTFIPYFNHTLSLADIFRAHNEHRIVFTRVYDLLLLIFNGQWDGELEMTLNAVIHCAGIAGFGWLMARLMGRENWPFIWLLLAVILALPFAWENTLGGFQSGFYFVLIFAMLTMWLLGLGEPRSKPWLWGVATGILGLFALASGAVAPMAVAALVMLDIAKAPKDWKRHLPTLLFCAGLALDGVLLKGHAPKDGFFKAHSIVELELSMGKNLAWPMVFKSWLMPLMLLPFILLAWIYYRTRGGDLRAERMILMVGGWAILQGVAAAITRGFEGRGPAGRYMDVECFMMVANGFAIVLLVRRYAARLQWWPVCYGAFALWGVFVIWGLAGLTDWTCKTSVPVWNSRQALRVANTRAYLATDDVKVLYKESDTLNLAYPFAPEFTTVLRDKNIRRILPACVQTGPPVERANADDGAFVRNGAKLEIPDPAPEPTWGSYAGNGVKRRGVFESAPIEPGASSYLEIPVAGNLGENGLRLELIDLKSGRVTEVKPARAPGERWANVLVKAPAGPYKIMARDDGDAKWFAFKSPRPMGWMSYWAVRLLGTWLVCLVVGSVCLVWALVGHSWKQPATRTALDPSPGKNLDAVRPGFAMQ